MQTRLQREIEAADRQIHQFVYTNRGHPKAADYPDTDKVGVGKLGYAAAKSGVSWRTII